MKEHIPEEAVASAARRGPSLPFYVIAIAVSIFLPILAVAL